ncbi:MAG: tetratricopeptide repeat protein [Candidatus Omnitrophica bacterium]|nr:tetratricopeptide repeat protein [Candidatus Omnitrophota bacterium]
MAEGPGKGNKGDKDFHETDYYAKFHEQEARLNPPDETSEDPSGEIDEDTIQDLMDATLSKAKPSESAGNLDTDVKADWLAGGEKDPDGSRPETGRRPPVGLSPQKTIRRTSHKGVVGKRRTPSRRKRWWQSKRRVYGALKWVFLVLFFAGLFGTFWYTQVTGRNILAELEAEAGRLHEMGDYAAALEKYQQLLDKVNAIPGYPMAKLQFLMGASNEGYWNKGRGPSESFEKANDHYDRAIELDQGEMKVYAVESLLAKSEMLVAKAGASDSPDPADIERAKDLLEEVIADRTFRANPMVNKGIPFRRLADLIREEDPVRAIDLLEQARKNQGDLEEGYENLEIGLIYKELLDDPDQAVEHFERVHQNELAPREVKQFADQQLEQLKSTRLEPPDLYSPDMLDKFPREGDLQ